MGGRSPAASDASVRQTCCVMGRMKILQKVPDLDNTNGGADSNIVEGRFCSTLFGCSVWERLVMVQVGPPSL